MKPRSLLILALVVAALGAFVWFVERDLPSTDERAERGRRVLPIEAEEVSAVEIRTGGESTRLERTAAPEEAEPGPEGDEPAAPADPEWRLVAPLEARADGDAVADLIAQLTGLEKERTLEDVDPSGLGLLEPRATVVLSAGGETWTLRIGEEIPASSNVLVARGEDAAELGEAYVVAGGFWDDLTRPAGEWRSRRAFAAEREDMVAVRLRGEREVLLERGESGFSIVAPFVDEARRDRVDELLAALTDLEIESFLDGPLDEAALGLDPAAAGLTVTLADGSMREVALGFDAEDEDAARYAAVDGQRFTAVTDLGTLVALDPDEWRSRDWSRLETWEIDAVDVRWGESAFRLEREDGVWRRDGVEIPYSAASDLLYAVADVEAEAVVGTDALAGAGEPLAELTLTAEEGSEILRLRAATERGHLAAREGRPSALLLTTAAVAELEAKVEAARDAEPVSSAAADEADES